MKKLFEEANQLDEKAIPIITQFDTGEIILKGKSAQYSSNIIKITDSGEQLIRIARKILNSVGRITITIEE